MKAKAEHVVPLSKPALKLLRALPRMAGTDLVFPSNRLAPLSDMTPLAAVMRRMQVRHSTWIPFHVPRLVQRVQLTIHARSPRSPLRIRFRRQSRRLGAAPARQAAPAHGRVGNLLRARTRRFPP